MLDIVDTFLDTEFEGGRHERRVKKIEAYENKHYQDLENSEGSE